MYKSLFSTFIVLFIPHIPSGLLGYCFHPWCPDGLAGGGRGGRGKFVQAVSKKTVRCRKLILGRGIG